jgi:hypothetical protein
MAIVAPIARRTGVLQVVNAIAGLKKVVDFERACGGTIGCKEIVSHVSDDRHSPDSRLQR